MSSKAYILDLLQKSINACFFIPFPLSPFPFPLLLQEVYCRDVPSERLYDGCPSHQERFKLILQFPIGGARGTRGVPPPPRLSAVLLSTICNA